MTSSALDQMVTALVPSLSRSLAEQFNVLRVMHHGTHEKQLSNVFAWLLRADGTHELGEAFQQLFIEQVNRSIPADKHLSTGGYRVIQEVDTSDHRVIQKVDTLPGLEPPGKDIADIVLTNEQASVVVENYEVSDGHGHDYYKYLAYGAAGGKKQSVVVLLCARRDSYRQTDGWENAAVVTYANLLGGLITHIDGDPVWRREHPRQDVFINELVQYFIEEPAAVSIEDRIAFIKTMCDTGESGRYGHRPIEAAAEEFGDLLGRHAKRQFEEGRTTLAEVKRALKGYAEQRLIGQVSDALPHGHFTSAEAPFVGRWEWSVALVRADPERNIYLEFGPTAVVENARVAKPVAEPDYTKVFVTRQAGSGDGIDMIIPTEVGLDEVLAGLSNDDDRLRDAVLAAISAL